MTARHHKSFGLLRKRFIVIAAVLLSTAIFPFRAYSSEKPIIREKVPIEAYDGTILAATVALPDSIGTYPTVLVRTPYGAEHYAGFFKRLTDRGYACVVEDTRGRFASGGVFIPFVHGVDDGDATMGWIRSQSWSNGVIATDGHSYNGFTALYAIAGNEEPPAATVVRHPVASPQGGLYRGGAMLHHFDYYWSILVDTKTYDLYYMFNLDWDHLFGLLPLNDAHRGVNRDIPFYRDWVQWANGSFGDGILPDPASIPSDKTAVLLIGGWFDLFGRDVVNLFTRLNAEAGNKRIKLIMGPFDHAASPPPDTGYDFGDWQAVNIGTEQEKWLDHWILGADNDAEESPAVRFFLLGENRWVSADSWPPEGARTQSFFLHSNGSANTAGGDGSLDMRPPTSEPLDQFTYDPSNPAPTVGGAICCLRQMTNAGPYDQSKIENRDDVLVYRSAVLDKSLTAVGPVEVELYAATSAKDTDFTAKLVDISPDGRSTILADGIIRARYRNGMGAPQFITPGDILLYRIELGPVANTFAKGHRIGIEISSSNFPRFDRNLNTGGPIGTEAVGVTAEQTVYHDNIRQSKLILTVADLNQDKR